MWVSSAFPLEQPLIYVIELGYLTNVLFSEGDCELEEFPDTSASGGTAVPSKTTRQQCEDHCLFYVRTFNTIVMGSRWNLYFLITVKVGNCLCMWMGGGGILLTFNNLLYKHMKQSYFEHFTSCSRPAGATTGRKDQQAARSMRNQRTISVTYKAGPFMSKSGKRARKVCLSFKACLSFYIVTARKRSLGQGNIFTSMCQEFWGCLVPGGGCLVLWGCVCSWSGGVPGPGGKGGILACLASFQAHSQGGSLGGSGWEGLHSHTKGGSWGGSGSDPHPRGKFRGIWSRPTPKGKFRGSGPGSHPRGKFRGIWSRPTPKGGSLGGSGQGPHPRGKLRGIWSRPTPKGEVEGDLVRGCGDHPPVMATAAGGMHPTGLHSCLKYIWLLFTFAKVNKWLLQ